MEENNVKAGPEEHLKLIEHTVTALKDDEGTDRDLLEILAEHLVRLDPASTGVSDAMAAVEELAKRRSESE